MGRTLELSGDDRPTTGYLAEPEGGGPGVVVIQEWWGLVPHIVDVCDRFAAAGFCAMAPDLYRGATAEEPDEAGRLMMSLDIERAAADLGSGIDTLLAQDSVTSEKVGVVGFCMGGKLVYFAAAARPTVIGAAVPFYGVVPWPEQGPDYSAIEAPIQGHYAEDDDFAPPEAVRELEARLADVGRSVEMFIYPGTHHAFFNDTNAEAYDAAAAEQAWERTTAFLRASLG